MNKQTDHLDIESVAGTLHFSELKSGDVSLLPFKEQVNDIMKNFDFVKVQKVMEHMKWGWAVGGSFDSGLLKVPTIEELKSEAYRLLKDCYLEPTSRWMISTGGLRVNKDDGYLQLEFVLEDWDCYDYTAEEMDQMEEIHE